MNGIHQQLCTGPAECGGEFGCIGCGRLMGWCFGGGNEFPDHCDDCYIDRFNVLALVCAGVNTNEVIADLCEAFAKHRGFQQVRTSREVVIELINDGLLQWQLQHHLDKMQVTEEGYRVMEIAWSGNDG